MHLVLVKRLGSLPMNSVVRLTDRLDMTIVVDWDVKPQIKQRNRQWRVSRLNGELFCPNIKHSKSGYVRQSSIPFPINLYII